MKSLLPLWHLAKLTWYEWAMREIHPLHADVPQIINSIADLKALRGAS
jgi:hypothetical protein